MLHKLYGSIIKLIQKQKRILDQKKEETGGGQGCDSQTVVQNWNLLKE